MHLTAKKWTIRFFITTFIFCGIPTLAIMGFNFYIDPLWNFLHAHEYNDFQYAADERQLKTNYVAHRPFQYDSLLIGSSRITYIDENSFQKEKVYNYSLSALHVEELEDYIKYAEEKNGAPFQKIYLELYFNSFNKKLATPPPMPPADYIASAEDAMEPITSLFSKNTFDIALENFESSKINHYDGPRSYNRFNVAQTTYPNDHLDKLWKEFVNNFSKPDNQHFVQVEGYKETLIQLTQAFPDSEFFVFTELIPAKRLQYTLQNEAYFVAYQQWIRQLVEVFDTVYSFHRVNEVTLNEDYFFDWLHYYPVVGDMIVESLENPEKSSIMTIVTQENVEDYLKNQ